MTKEKLDETLLNITEEKLETLLLDERNIGAELMAKRILKEFKNPTDGKFDCKEANEIIELYKKKGR